MIEFSGKIEDLNPGIHLSLEVDGEIQDHLLTEGALFLRLQEHFDRLNRMLCRKVDQERKAQEVAP